MEKYDAMVEKNKKKNAGKQMIAIRTIRSMLKDGEQITVRAVSKRSGLSVSMFYHNEQVRSELHAAMRQQIGPVYVRKRNPVFERAVKTEEAVLRRKLEMLKKENVRLKELVKAAGMGSQKTV